MMKKSMIGLCIAVACMTASIFSLSANCRCVWKRGSGRLSWINCLEKSKEFLRGIIIKKDALQKLLAINY